MPTVTASYKIDSDSTGANEKLDYRNQASGEVTTFPANTRITSATISFKGLRRNSSSGQGTHSFSIALEAGAGGTSKPVIWNSSTTLGGTGGDGECTISDISISYSDGKLLASTGVSDMKLESQQSRNLNAATSSTATAVFTYEYLPTISEFTKLSASAQTNAGKTTVIWSSCTGSNGSGSVTYELIKGSTSLYSGSGTSVTLNVSDIGYGTSTLTIYAYYSGEYVKKEAQVTFYEPSMTAPTLSISNTTGMEAELTWTAAKLNYTSGTIKYDIYKDGSLFAESALSPYPLYKGIVSTWGGSPVTLTLKATATITGNTYSGSTMVEDSNAVTFTYIVTITRCGAPTVVTIQTPLSYSSVRLSWDGATSGTDNTITGYNIRSADSEDGNMWSGWSDPVFISSSPTYVESPSTPGSYRKFCVETCGSAGADYYSDTWTESGTLRKDISPTYVQFTDSTLYAGTTKPKAVHMTELQDLINALHEFNNEDAVIFSSIKSQQTSLLDWKDHVIELRAATDAIVPSHDAWISIPKGLPSAAVITQIRNILLAYYNER